MVNNQFRRSLFLVIQNLKPKAILFFHTENLKLIWSKYLNVCVMNHVLIMVLNQLKIVFSMELEIAIQSGVYKRAKKTKKMTILLQNLHFAFNFYFINFI